MFALPSIQGPWASPCARDRLQLAPGHPHSTANTAEPLFQRRCRDKRTRYRSHVFHGLQSPVLKVEAARLLHRAAVMIASCRTSARGSHVSRFGVNPSHLLAQPTATVTTDSQLGGAAATPEQRSVRAMGSGRTAQGITVIARRVGRAKLLGGKQRKREICRCCAAQRLHCPGRPLLDRSVHVHLGSQILCTRGRRALEDDHTTFLACGATPSIT